MDLSVVIPIRNEADSIGPLVAEIRAALDGALDYEIIAVDDASDDATAERLAALAREQPRLAVLRHPTRYGQSTAIRTGVAAAGAPLVATIDGDGQDDPADIPPLLRHFTEVARPPRPHLVCGYRRRRRDGWRKRWSSRVANAVRRRLLGDRTPDTGCGLKVFERQTFLELPYFDHMHRFLPALVMRSGGTVSSVEVRHRPRQYGVSSYGVRDRLWVGIVDLLGVMWLQRRRMGPPPSGKE